MATQLFANNASSTLAAGITNVATALTLVTGQGALFPNPTGGDWFLLTLTQGTGAETSWEIVKVTARATDVLTIVRAQESTTAAAWSAGAKAEARLTAGSLIPAVAGGQNGLMLGSDKTKLDAITGTHTGTNTGDNAVNSLYSSLVSNATHTGDVSGATILTLAAIITAAGPIGSASAVPVITFDAKGRLTAVSSATITPAAIGAQAAGTYATGTGSASGTNTGDETTATIKTKLGITTLSGSNTGDQTIPTTLPASDVYAWAKASVKPSYTASEVGAYSSSGGTLSGNLDAVGFVKSQKAQTANDYTTAALWTQSFNSTATGIAFHISGNVGKMLYMDTAGVLRWAGNQVIDASVFSGSHSGTSSGTNTGDQTNISGNAATATALWDATAGIRLVNPGGASISTSPSSQTGAIKIRMPSSSGASNAMISLRIKVYTYDGLSYEICCGGYPYSTTWANVFAYMTTQSRGALNVRFANDGTYAWIYIGETSTAWSYPQVFVTDLQAGYSGLSSYWASGWAVSFETALASVAATTTVYPAITSGNITSQSVSYATTAGSAPANGGTATTCTSYSGLSSVINSDWFRTGGTSGLYFSTYQVGWHANVANRIDTYRDGASTMANLRVNGSPGYWLDFGPLNSTWCHFNTNTTGGVYFYNPIYGNSTITAAGGFSGNLSGNATTATTAGSITSQANSATTACSVTASASTLVQRNPSGYIFNSYINTTDDTSSGTALSYLIAKCGDDYHRSINQDDLKKWMGYNRKTTYRRIDSSTDINYHTGSIGWSGWDMGQTGLWAHGSCFFDVWSGTNFPPSTTHVHGFQAMHYTTGSSGYGMRICSQYDQPGTLWTQNVAAGTVHPWYKIWTNATLTSVSQLSNDSGYITGAGNAATATRANGAPVFWSSSHPVDYYLVNNWTGAHWQITSNHSAGVRVAYADSAGSAPASGGTSAACSGNAASATYAYNCNSWFYFNSNYGHGVVGLYNSTIFQGVFAMGDAYKLGAGGNISSLYGICWSHPNAGGIASNLDSHGLIVAINGGFGSCMSYSIVASGNVTAYSDERLKRNWRDFDRDFVSQLAGVKTGIYDRIDMRVDAEGGAIPVLTQVGVSAQSLRLVLPNAVQEADDDMKTLSVAYGNAALASCVMLARKAVNHEERIRELEAEIVWLKAA